MWWPTSHGTLAASTVEVEAMRQSERPQVICLPGGVAPAAERYAPLVGSLAGAADLYVKDLEVYARDKPAPDYSVELELRAVDDFADARGLNRFHLVGYSGGGFLSLA